jgi:hypothetical protein
MRGFVLTGNPAQWTVFPVMQTPECSRDKIGFHPGIHAEILLRGDPARENAERIKEMLTLDLSQ